MLYSPVHAIHLSVLTRTLQCEHQHPHGTEEKTEAHKSLNKISQVTEYVSRKDICVYSLL